MRRFLSIDLGQSMVTPLSHSIHKPNASYLTRGVLVVFSVCIWFLFSGFKVQEMESADAIMAKVTQNLATQSEIGLVLITTTTNDGNVSQRRLLSIIRKDPAGNFSYMIRFLAPDDVKDVTLLTRETGDGESDQFLYLPALGKVREIKGNQKSSYFMGTDFTFEDLRKEKTMEYTYARQFDETIRGRECHVILSAPADQMKLAAKGFGSRMVYVDKQTYNVLKIEYYDETGELNKTFEAYDYNSSEVDGPTRRPRRAVMTNHAKGSTSVMVLLKSRLNYDIDPAIFSVEAIEAWNDEFTQAYLTVFDTPQAQ